MSFTSFDDVRPLPFHIVQRDVVPGLPGQRVGLVVELPHQHPRLTLGVRGGERELGRHELVPRHPQLFPCPPQGVERHLRPHAAADLVLATGDLEEQRSTRVARHRPEVVRRRGLGVEPAERVVVERDPHRHRIGDRPPLPLERGPRPHVGRPSLTRPTTPDDEPRDHRPSAGWTREPRAPATPPSPQQQPHRRPHRQRPEHAGDGGHRPPPAQHGGHGERQPPDRDGDAAHQRAGDQP